MILPKLNLQIQHHNSKDTNVQCIHLLSRKDSIMNSIIMIYTLQLLNFLLKIQYPTGQKKMFVWSVNILMKKKNTIY